MESEISRKMEGAGLAVPTVRSFVAAVRQVVAGERGMLPELAVMPVEVLPRMADLPAGRAGDAEVLRELAVIKLNGGLGTTMGLERAKSLIAVKPGQTFLDLTARQILHLRAGRAEPAFYLMNSYSTRGDTLTALERYPELVTPGEPLDFVQSRVPKLDATTLQPVWWAKDPELEWCPPGHGDIYPSLVGTGLLGRLLARGIRYLFVSNADNLGAAVDVRLLRHFADSGLSFLMEVAERTPADRKGGHLARRVGTGRLLLRESAQTPKEDEGAFQDIGRHRFFNTNNLWVRLDHLQEELDRGGGMLALPLIMNRKTVDPKDPASPKVLQLETAMGAAIECFEKSGAIVVGRDRFAPVKTTSDLLVVRSDAYGVTEDQRLALDERCGGRVPAVRLDAEHYRVMSQFESLVPEGAVPSLVGCESLVVEGPVLFEPGVVCEGRVEFTNRSGKVQRVAAGVYRGKHELG